MSHHLRQPTIQTPQYEAVKRDQRPALVTITASSLMTKTLPPVRWAVQGVVPEGLVLFAGKPKMGKSWLALGLALAVASGRPAFGSVPVEQGTVLYLALEDHERRLQDRLAMALAGESAPGHLDLAIACQRLDRGGLDEVERWLRAHPTARLVILDTLARVRAPMRVGGNVYQDDYQALSGLKGLAERYHVAMLVVHHLRKGVALDPVDEISGSTGLSGVADSLMVLVRQRGAERAVVRLSGRDVEECEIPLTFDGTRGAWRLSANTSAPHMSRERQAVLEALQALDPVPGTPKQVSQMLGKSPAATRQLMHHLEQGGQIYRHKRGTYGIQSFGRPAVA